ncbi:MAG: hypothetical protein ACO3QC_01265 [Phycisphaerales bacterium]
MFHAATRPADAEDGAAPMATTIAKPAAPAHPPLEVHETAARPKARFL